MKKLLMSFLLGWCISTAVAGPGGKIKAVRKVNPAAVQRAVERTVLPVQSIRISNLPGKPVVQFRAKEPIVTPKARLVPAKKVGNLFFIKSSVSSQFSAGNMFVPRGLLGPQKAVYRGMSLQLAELTNLLVKGLEPRKSIAHRKVYTALAPTIALAYANPAVRTKKDAFPVLVKIPFVPELKNYAPHMLQDIPNGNIVFDRDLPPHFISDVWVFLEVNGQAGWYKAVLEGDELVLLPADAELRIIAEGFKEWKYEPGVDN